MAHRRYLISGRVQGVGFRWFAQRNARRLGVTGYARNLSNGQVEVVAEGSDEALMAMEGELKIGPPGARVEQIQVVDASADDTGFSTFETG